MSSEADSTLWLAPPHTVAKHDLYRRYIQAWLPILAFGGYPRVLIVDGFAGPGRYLLGEDGSPIVALKAVLEHDQLAQILGRTVIRFLFVEYRKDRYDSLKWEISQLSIPPRMDIDVRHATFDSVWSSEINALQQSGGILEPALIFVDPFGPTGFPMELIRRAAAYQGSEVLINFAYQSLNQRFTSQERMHGQVDDLFGNENWRACMLIEDSLEREKCLVSTYQESLASSGWQGVAFQMLNAQHQSQYYLIYGTRHHLGMRAFKNAAWSVAPDGQFQFSDLRIPEQSGFLRIVSVESTVDELSMSLIAEYKNRLVSKSDLDEFTDNHPTARLPHLRSALSKLESQGSVVEVILPNNRKRNKGSFPPDCQVRFAS